MIKHVKDGKRKAPEPFIIDDIAWLRVIINEEHFIAALLMASHHDIELMT